MFRQLSRHGKKLFVRNSKSVSWPLLLVWMIWVFVVCYTRPFAVFSSGEFLGVDGTGFPNPPKRAIAIVILAHDRIEYFEACIKSVLNASSRDLVDIIVSMDYKPAFDSLRAMATGLDQEIMFWETADAPFFIIGHRKIGYHYRQVFKKGFIDSGYDYVVALESDLIVSRDFIEYFLSLAHLLDPERSPRTANTLWCISAWNDNGMKYFILDEKKILRTDFFPGLGWMMHRSTWTDTLSPIWGYFTDHYDWWLRERSELKGRDCLFPEVPRTHHISTHGMNVNGKDHEWYAEMALSQQNKFSISERDLELVGSLPEYEAELRREGVDGYRVATFISSARITASDSPLIYVFSHDDSKENSYSNIAKLFHLYPTFRSSHRGLMTLVLGAEFGFSSVTLIDESQRGFWGV